MDTNEIQELKNLIQALNSKIDVKLGELDKKIDVRFGELDKKIDVRFAELDKKIDVKFAELDKKIDVKFAEVNGELKVINERIDGVKERLANEEVLTRTVFAGIILAVIGAVFKLFFFADKV